MFAQNLLTGMEIYAAIGVFAAAAFLFIGLDRIDPSARGAYAFRPLVIPGAIILWPLVLWRWFRLAKETGVGS